MVEIPLNSKAKRPGFFADSAVDQMMTMMLEMMTELWVVKERVYALEQVLNNEGLSVTDKINSSKMGDAQTAELEVARLKYIETIMRSLESNFVARADLQHEVDDLTSAMKNNTE